MALSAARYSLLRLEEGKQNKAWKTCEIELYKFYRSNYSAQGYGARFDTFSQTFLCVFELSLSRSTPYQELATTVAHSLQTQRRFDAKIPKNVCIRFSIKGWQRFDRLHGSRPWGLRETPSCCNHCQTEPPQTHG